MSGKALEMMVQKRDIEIDIDIDIDISDMTVDSPSWWSAGCSTDWF